MMCCFLLVVKYQKHDSLVDKIKGKSMTTVSFITALNDLNSAGKGNGGMIRPDSRVDEVSCKFHLSSFVQSTIKSMTF